jgi:hypothetical protein
MTLHRSGYKGDFAAQCDSCHEVMDFEPDDNFYDCVNTLRASGWRARKQTDGSWKHECSDCAGGLAA